MLPCIRSYNNRNNICLPVPFKGPYGFPYEFELMESNTTVITLFVNNTNSEW